MTRRPMTYPRARRYMTVVVCALAATFIVAPVGLRIVAAVFWLFVTPTLERYVQTYRDAEQPQPVPAEVEW